MSSTPPTGRPAPEAIPTLGSGWGDDIAIVQDDDTLTVERVFFRPREVQPPIRYRYALDGSDTQNRVNLGRSLPPAVSTTFWRGDRLVIATRHPVPDPDGGWSMEGEVVRTLWLEPASRTPWEPRLVVETRRGGVMGGLASTNRTVYNRGYR